MAFLKTARAVVVRPHVTPETWRGLRKIASVTPSTTVGIQADKILGGPLDPSKYLVTHCTIVASVDAMSVPGVKTGKIKVGSKTVDRRWAEYFVTPETDKYINNNQDAFSREVLLKAYPTFIGAQNYLEHVQIEEQSKGRVIDAVARDIGDSIYVDILVATDRKHDQLIRQIESGSLTTLSMGCICDATQCTKCGNVAADETQLCDCIKYEKGNYFIDDQGSRRRVAELCGHPSMNANGGVKYIEASWVAVPAFQGAVMRNIIQPTDEVTSKAARVLNTPPDKWSSLGSLQKAASQHVAFDIPEEGGEGGGDAKPEAPADPLQQAEDQLFEELRDRVVKRVKNTLEDKKKPDAVLPPAEGASVSTNENLTKMAYLRALDRTVRTASSREDLVSSLKSVNNAFGVVLSSGVYWTAYRVGSLSSHPSLQSYVAACKKAANRNLTEAELRAIIRIGSLLARRARFNAGE